MVRTDLHKKKALHDVEVGSKVENYSQHYIGGGDDTMILASISYFPPTNAMTF